MVVSKLYDTIRFTALCSHEVRRRLQPGAQPTGDRAVISGVPFILRLENLIEAAYQVRESRDDALGFPFPLSLLNLS